MMTDGNEMSADAYDPYDFANRRHIGPSPEEIAEMLRIVGVSSLEGLIDETVPKDIRLVQGARLRQAAFRARRARSPARDREQEPRPDVAHRPRLSWNDHAAGDPAQHSGESGMVYGLHALSAGGQPGAT